MTWSNKGNFLTLKEAWSDEGPSSDICRVIKDFSTHIHPVSANYTALAWWCFFAQLPSWVHFSHGVGIIKLRPACYLTQKSWSWEFGLEFAEFQNNTWCAIVSVKEIVDTYASDLATGFQTDTSFTTVWSHIFISLISLNKPAPSVLLRFLLLPSLEWFSVLERRSLLKESPTTSRIVLLNLQPLLLHVSKQWIQCLWSLPRNHISMKLLLLAAL